MLWYAYVNRQELCDVGRISARESDSESNSSTASTNISTDQAARSMARAMAAREDLRPLTSREVIMEMVAQSEKKTQRTF
jgi:hypothetical protein